MLQSSIAKVEYSYSHSGTPSAHGYLLPTIKHLFKKLCDGGEVLDLGCGNGALCHALSSIGFTVTGIDRSRSGIEVGSKAFPEVRFIQADIEQDSFLYDFRNENFDIVVSTEVIEHLFNPRTLVQSSFRLLKPGGYLVVSTPYHGYLKNLCLAATGKLDNHFTALWDGGHIKFWSRHTLSLLLDEAGFTNLQFAGSGRVPYLWKSMILIGQKPTWSIKH